MLFVSYNFIESMFQFNVNLFQVLLVLWQCENIGSMINI